MAALVFFERAKRTRLHRSERSQHSVRWSVNRRGLSLMTLFACHLDALRCAAGLPTFVSRTLPPIAHTIAQVLAEIMP